MLDRELFVEIRQMDKLDKLEFRNLEFDEGFQPYHPPSDSGNLVKPKWARRPLLAMRGPALKRIASAWRCRANEFTDGSQVTAGHAADGMRLQLA